MEIWYAIVFFSKDPNSKLEIMKALKEGREEDEDEDEEEEDERQHDKNEGDKEDDEDADAKSPPVSSFWIIK